MNHGLFILGAVITALILLAMLMHGVGFIKEFFTVLKDEEENGKILAYGNPTPGTYTVLAVRDFYDKAHQGIKILAETQDSKRSVFWTRYDPIAYVTPDEFRFFDTLIPGDRISVSVNDETGIRITPFYGQ